MFDHIPVGVGSKGIIPMNARDLEEALEMGMDWSLREGERKSIMIKLNKTKQNTKQCDIKYIRLHLG